MCRKNPSTVSKAAAAKPTDNTPNSPWRSGRACSDSINSSVWSARSRVTPSRSTPASTCTGWVPGSSFIQTR